MNKLLLLFLLLLNFSAFSQKKLEGSFETQSLGSHEGSSYKFFKDGTFIYSQSSFLYSIKGKGNYTLNKKLLRLQFIPYQISDTFFITTKKECKNNDSIRTIFSLRHLSTKEPIPYNTIVLKLKHSNKLIASSHTNLAGVTSITLPRMYHDSIVSCSIVTDRILFKNFSFEFKPNSCKDITIELLEDFNKGAQTIPNGTIWEYIFEKFSEKKSNRKGIILRNPSNPEVYETVLYKRKSKN